MPSKKHNTKGTEIKSILEGQEDYLKAMVERLLQEVLEAQMDKVLGAGKSERSPDRIGYRSGHYKRWLITRVGSIELMVPQDREGRFSTEVFDLYQRSEKALVSALAEMYVKGVSTRKVKAITERLCGHSFSASTVSRINKGLDEELENFAARKLEGEYPYVILDARYEKVRRDGAVRSQAVLIAIGVNSEGIREVLGVELAQRESRTSWSEFLESLKQRGLHGVELVISDDHSGLRRAIEEKFTEALWQRCSVHFIRNALDHLPRKGGDQCIRELKGLFKLSCIDEANAALRAWIGRWEENYSKLCAWVEENIEETFMFYQFPAYHHMRIRSTNMLERVNQELKRRSRVVRIFPNEESCLRLIRAMLVELHEEWATQNTYLNMKLLKEREEKRGLKYKKTG